MLFPGDTKNFVLSIIKNDGTAPNVTSAPVISVIRLSDNTVVVNSLPMTLLAGSQAVYIYAWTTNGVASGDYLALVSYASDGVTVNSRFSEVVHLGNTYIQGPVALDATVAKDATVAQAATTAAKTDLTAISPDNSATVAAIKAKTDNLPIDPASLSSLSTIQTLVQSLADAQFGIWTIDKTQTPQVLTILNKQGTTVASFQLTDSSTTTQRLPISG